MQETWVQSLDWAYPLEKGKTTHSSILAWRIPWMEEPGGLQSMGLQRVGQHWGQAQGEPDQELESLLCDPGQTLPALGLSIFPLPVKGRGRRLSSPRAISLS